jgi:hypothetical protein
LVSRVIAGRQAPLPITVLGHVQVRHRLDDSPLGLVEMSEDDEMVGQATGLVERPGLEAGHKLALVNQPILEGKQSKEQVAVGGDGGHGKGFPRIGHGSQTSGPLWRTPVPRFPRVGWIIACHIIPRSPAPPNARLLQSVKLGLRSRQARAGRRCQTPAGSSPRPSSAWSMLVILLAARR